MHKKKEVRGVWAPVERERGRPTRIGNALRRATTGKHPQRGQKKKQYPKKKKKKGGGGGGGGGGNAQEVWR